MSSGRAEIPFNRAAHTGREEAEIAAAIARGHLAADGPRSEWCSAWLERNLGSPVLLVHSCTAALEMAAILLDIRPGDEVIMPSYTFVSTANAFVLRGAVPVFVDVDEDTLNIDPGRIAEAVSPRTRAVVPVHYAGVVCDIESVAALAEGRGIAVVEDAAQGFLASSCGRPLGTSGTFGALSFHETKNVTCGEGGALIINDRDFLERAEIIRSKGTNRSQFDRGQVDRYTWVDIGSSYAMSEVNAAFLSAQLAAAFELTARRLEIWQRYHESLSDLEDAGRLIRPRIPAGATHNAHLYPLRLADRDSRDGFIRYLRERSVNPVFHYVPLHDSPAGIRYGRVGGPLPVTERAADCLVRLPLWSEMTDQEVDRVIEAVGDYFRSDARTVGV